MSIELKSLVRAVDKDPSIAAVIFTGKDTFITHADVGELLDGARTTPFPIPYRLARANVAPLGRLLERLGPLERALRTTRLGPALTLPRIYRTLRRMNASETVYIAAINGVAFGMGAILALACDLRVMSDDDDAAFGFIETGISILAAVGGTQRLTRMVGPSRALELLLDGRWMSPQEAADVGLIHRVVPREQLQDEALALAQRLATRSPVMNREIKRMVYEAGEVPFRRAIRMEHASMLTTLSQPRAAQDMATYLAELGSQTPPDDRHVLAIWRGLLGMEFEAAAAPPVRRRRSAEA
jgi:enoyl-CoA hydratase